MQFNTIHTDDFTTFKAGCTLAYVEIEKKLIEIGGNGIKGNEFKKTCLTKAGWKYGKLTAYGAHPDVAAETFSKLKNVLESLKDDEIEAQIILDKLTA